MSFTDLELEVLKKNCASDPAQDWMKALIGRLEAAELLAGRFTGHMPDCPIGKTSAHCDCGYPERLAEWRKAAGK